ncbi:MAG: ribosome biogenesis GTP-binding protein YihA/YsxC [Candidatus Sumerlaeaceae bacterium]|nr:ribosome biogenesis GTP-binding protein YihA/YsxC [Candidatus Sumerlaeaceae bacterium]
MTTGQPSFEVKQVEFFKSAEHPKDYPKDSRPQIAFAGRSNVGKSSLLNVVVNRKSIARVSNTPGRTQLINFFLVNGSMYFVDLPGYGFAKAPKSVKAGWDRMMTSFMLNNPNLRGVVTLFDIRRALEDDDRAMLDFLAHNGIPVLAVLTKMDKLPRSHQMEARKRFTADLAYHAGPPPILFSATSRQGRTELLDAIGERAAAPPLSALQPGNEQNPGENGND